MLYSFMSFVAPSKYFEQIYREQLGKIRSPAKESGIENGLEFQPFSFEVAVIGMPATNRRLWKEYTDCVPWYATDP